MRSKRAIRPPLETARSRPVVAGWQAPQTSTDRLSTVERTSWTAPQLEHVATYDFCYDRPRELDDSQLDTVLVLRRR